MTYRCPVCCDDWRFRASSLDTVQRCRGCGARVYLWAERLARPPMLLWPHILAIILTFGLWLPGWLLCVLIYYSQPAEWLIHAEEVRKYRRSRRA